MAKDIFENEVVEDFLKGIMGIDIMTKCEVYIDGSSNKYEGQYEVEDIFW